VNIPDYDCATHPAAYPNKWCTAATDQSERFGVTMSAWTARR
jgi:hypothetical protein